MNNFLKKNDDFCSRNSLTISGSDQAREGRLVDALAVRGEILCYCYTLCNQ